MKIVVIGGSGHIGTYLIPKLVKAGYETVNVTRGQSKPYVSDRLWNEVENVILDRTTDNDFAEKIASLNADVVIDLINFTLDDTKKMVSALGKTNLSLYLFCSSIWTHGRAEILPALSDCDKEPLDEYGVNKYQSGLFLKDQYEKSGFPYSIIMPGQIAGPGWLIVNPYANLDTCVFEKIAKGEKIYLPNFGMETLHHIHADDLAQMFFKAVTHKDNAINNSFHGVPEQSITLYGYAKFMYEFFNQKPDIGFMEWSKWCEYMGDKDYIEHSYYHLVRSGYYSIENAKKLLDYEPKYTITQTITQSIQSYIDRKIIKI